MRLVDLRGTSTPAAPVVEIRASEAAELLRLIGVLADVDARGGYDVGADRIAAVADALPDGLLDRARGLGGLKAFFSLSIVAAQLEAPADVDLLLDRLHAEPTLAWRTLLSVATADWDWEGSPADADAIVAGDPAALDRLAAWCGTDRSGVPEHVRSLLGTDAVAHGREVAAVIEATRAAVWADLAPEAMRAIVRDVDHRRERVAAGDDAATVVLEATNGFVHDEDASIRRVLLLPSFWLRPWNIVDQLGDTLVLSTPVADAFVALPAEVPPPSLLKLSKALADEGRLKLLRRMSTGPVSLGEATEHLGVAKATAHHHLSILRQAGLVVMHGGGRSTRYALRLDPAEAAHDALAAYVPPRPEPRSSGATAP